MRDGDANEDEDEKNDEINYERLENEGQLVMLEFEKMRMNFQMVLGLQKEVILERAQNFGVKETIATHGEVEKSVRVT
ncbi:hypothetical protein Tco_0933026 [Tanacetum coccineum]